jgi:hypothetical protein
MPTDAKVPADMQRKRRACANYAKNAAGKWVRKRAWRCCDYTQEGHLKEFDSEEALLQFEEDRYQQGASQAHYEKQPRGTVPREQLALEEAITHAVAKDGNETRVQLQSVEESLHERHDQQHALLGEIRAHLDSQSAATLAPEVGVGVSNTVQAASALHDSGVRCFYSGAFLWRSSRVPGAAGAQLSWSIWDLLELLWNTKLCKHTFDESCQAIVATSWPVLILLISLTQFLPTPALSNAFVSILDTLCNVGMSVDWAIARFECSGCSKNQRLLARSALQDRLQENQYCGT